MRGESIIAIALLAVVIAELSLLWREPSLAPRAGRLATGTAEPVSSSAARPGHAPGLTKEAEERILLGDIARVPFQELFGLLAQRAPAEIAGLAGQLATLPRSSNTDARISAFYKVWTMLDPKAALASALALSQAHLRDRALRTVVNNADPSAAGEMARAINQLPPNRLDRKEKASLLSAAAGRWAQAEPVAAAHFLDTLDAKGMEFSITFNNVASYWAAQEPAAALAWAQNHGDNYGNMARQGALNGWWQTDPRAAEAYVASHPLIDRGEMFASFASMLFSQEPERAREWVSQLPNAEGRRSAISIVAQQWAMQDPAAAAQWVASLPETDRGGTLGSIARVWARQDPAAAGKFLNSLGGEARDEAVVSYSSAVSYEEPALALTWAGTIADPARRQKLQADLAAEWLKQDPTAARTWIANSTLSEEEKARLLEPSPP